MRLLIDLGHTRLKWAWAAGGRLQAGGALSWQDRDTSALVEALTARADLMPERIGVAAVARAAPVSELLAALQERFGIAPTVLSATRRWGAVTCGYDEPAALGVDRWAAVVGAWRRAPGHPAVVVDAGSALTLDLLTADGRHLGGSIAPGLALARAAFYARTARTEEAGRAQPGGCARNTADAVASGALLAAIGAVEAVWRRHAGGGEPPLLWLTGGDAGALSSVLAVAHEVVPDLVFEGMDVLLGGRE